MNQRILQLAVEADEYTKQTVHYYQGQFNGLTWEGKIKQTRDTKFAELIVQECAQVCADRVAHHDGLYSAWASDCSERIEKHFGVEE